MNNRFEVDSAVSRREFVKVASAVPVGIALGQTGSAAGIAGMYDGLASEKYLGPVRRETVVKDHKVFTEGPAVSRSGEVYFTNVPASKILKWQPKRKRLTTFRKMSHRANGLLFDPEGNLLACEGGAGRVTRTDMPTGEISILADEYNGFPFAPPNDLAFDAKGRVYFTSRPGTTDPKKGNVNAVYRIDPDGSVSQLLHWPDVHMPNGIVTSPDDKVLYLIEADGRKNHNRCIFAYDLADDGTLSNRRTLIDFYPGRSGDGMGIDRQGNLYVAAGLHERRGSSETLDTRPGIHVISPKGELLAFRETPEDTITNCTFGGKDLKTLYITCGRLLLSLRTTVAGKAAYRPKA